MHSGVAAVSAGPVVTILPEKQIRQRLTALIVDIDSGSLDTGIGLERFAPEIPVSAPTKRQHEMTATSTDSSLMTR